VLMALRAYGVVTQDTVAGGAVDETVRDDADVALPRFVKKGGAVDGKAQHHGCVEQGLPPCLGD